MFWPFKRKLDLREKGIRYVRKNFGEEYIQEFCEKYDSLRNGVPIGGYVETYIFLRMIEEIKKR